MSSHKKKRGKKLNSAAHFGKPKVVQNATVFSGHEGQPAAAVRQGRWCE